MPTCEEILRFVQEQSYPGRHVEISSDLVRDLGIDGDDADEFFEELLKQFPVKLPVIDWSQHFHSEGELLDPLFGLKYVAHKLGLYRSAPRRELKPFIVRDLLKFYGLNE